ncbi:MAG: tetratricopeptide repeat protein, partial [Planctomycetota bacterium]
VFKKTIRRYRGPVSMAAALIVLAVGASIALSVMYSNQGRLLVQVEEREREATEARDQLQTVVTFQSSMLSEIDAEEMGRGIITNLRDGIRESLEAASSTPAEVAATIASLDASVERINPTNLALSVVDKYVLSRAVETLEQEFADQPLVEAALQQTVGNTYAELGMYSEAVPRIERALALHRRTLGDDHPDTLVSISSMGHLLKLMGKLADAEPLYREALEGRRAVLGGDHPDTLTSIHNMGALLKRMGRLSDAELYHREALEGYRRVLGDDHPDTLVSISSMGHLLKLMGKLANAEPYYREALQGQRRVLGDDDPRTLTSMNNMGSLLLAMGKFTEAEPYHREALEGKRRVLGDDHPDTLTSIHNMGGLLRDQGRLEEAEGLGEEAVRRARETMPMGHWITAAFLSEHARTLAAMERFAEAEAEMLEAHEMLVAALGAEHKRTIGLIKSLTDLYDAWHAAEPAKGYDAKAAQWRKQLPATSQPTSASADVP